MAHDMTRVDHGSLKAAKKKCRQLTKEIENARDHRDLLHSVYKLQAFLADALPQAWNAAELDVPEAVSDAR